VNIVRGLVWTTANTRRERKDYGYGLDECDSSDEEY
jgi:hypothetical protein